MNKNCNENSNICCDAKNCVYHSKDCKCTADSIKISNPSACSSSATSCETFRMKDGCSSGSCI